MSADTDAFKTYVADLEDSAHFTAWCTDHSAECSAWKTYSTALLAGQTPQPPAQQTSLGKSMVDAAVGIMGGPSPVPPPAPIPPPPAAEAFAWDVQALAVHPNSAAWIKSLLTTTDHGYASAMQAEAVVTDHADCYQVQPGITGMDSTIWIPAGTKGGLSSDHHLTIIDQVTGRVHDTWLAKDTTGDGKIDHFGGGKSYPDDLTTPYVTGQGSTNAANVQSPPWNIHPEDVARGHCLHALRFPFHYPSNGKPLYPASPYARAYPVPPGVAANPPIGVMVRLKTAAALGAGAGPLERCVFNTLRGDAGPGGAVGTDGGYAFTFKARDLGGGGQSEKEWAAVGVVLEKDATGAFRGGLLGDKGLSPKFTRIPWDQLEVVVLPAGS